MLFLFVLQFHEQSNRIKQNGEYLDFFFGLNKTAHKNQKDVTPSRLLA